MEKVLTSRGNRALSISASPGVDVGHHTSKNLDASGFLPCQPALADKSLFVWA